jgi:terminal uridylyltransferase
MDRQTRQAQYLEQVASVEVRNVEMSHGEREEKEAFRLALEKLCHEVCAANPERIPKISLEPFGSFQSGFATAGSDMDLVIVVKDHDSTSACFSLLEDDLPRALERKLLEVGYGARLLTRTRVPILKVCEKPEGSFLDKLREERWKWDDLPNEKKYPHLHTREEDADEDVPAHDPNAPISTTVPVEDPNAPIVLMIPTSKPAAGSHGEALSPTPNTNTDAEPQHLQTVRSTPPPEATTGAQQPDNVSNASQQTQRDDTRREEKQWTRERKAGPLDFPKTGVGIQSDINFFNPLGMHNTHLLRCYSLCDPRVRPMVLFVKAWAKKRKINSSYSGTLSSYGYVLMVLHYLMNVTNPPVLPNLQDQGVHQTGLGEVVDGYVVRFWRNEEDIKAAAQRGQLTANREPLGSLLNGFYQYYASSSYGVTFRWMQEVLSLRSPGGILAKTDKGWVKAVTEESEGKKVQHRYLFCIEDPFELDHNVARTVTHNGIVAIRDEFRRANRILQAIGNGHVSNEGELFADLIEVENIWKATVELKKANGVQNGAVDGAPETEAPKVPEMRNFFANRAEYATSHHHPNANLHQNPRRGRGRGYGPPPQTRAMDLHDNEVFPTLRASKPNKKKAPNALEAGEEFSEISGDQAKAHLAEVKRMKDEEQAESTAKGAAEAVLNGID